LDTMQKDLVWYPEAILSQPFGSGTKVYESDDAVQMIHDMEEYSSYSEPYDAISLLSQQPNRNMQIDSQILNMIVPHSL